MHDGHSSTTARLNARSRTTPALPFIVTFLCKSRVGQEDEQAGRASFDTILGLAEQIMLQLSAQQQHIEARCCLYYMCIFSNV